VKKGAPLICRRNRKALKEVRSGNKKKPASGKKKRRPKALFAKGRENPEEHSGEKE